MKNGIDGAKRDKKREMTKICKIKTEIRLVKSNTYNILFQKLQKLHLLHYEPYRNRSTILVVFYGRQISSIGSL